MTYPDRDPREAARPTERIDPVPPPSPADEALRRREIEERATNSRVKTVLIVCAVIDIVCSLFAIVLAIHIFLVIGNANPANGFAQFIESFSGGVSLGLRDLFTPENIGVRTLLNDGLAAILWLVIRTVLTTLITRLALPVEDRRVWYRRPATY